ncbi:MAG: hypothetical protein K2I42_06895 [Anaeroplasmataceae bacterium]|nr:hypothetical protein [Anaeroplasmataceae bacterium]
MFKKRLITLCITLFALFAVVGAGFSSWYFSNQRRSDVFSNVVVTHANTFGQFENVSSGNYYLMLDQPKKNGSTIMDHNITLRTGTDENNSPVVDTLSATWTVSLASYQDTLKSGTAVTVENSYIEYSVIVYIKDATLGQYVEVGGSTGFSNANFHSVAGEHNHRNEGYTAYKLTFTSTTDAENDLVFTNTSENTNSTTTGAYVTLPTGDTGTVSVGFILDLKDVPFQWKADKAPSTFQEYQDMVRTLACKGVSTAQDVTGGKIYETEGKDLIIEFAVYNTSPDAPVIDVTQE